MGTLEQAKMLGGIGSILMLLTMVPVAGPVLGIVGFVLVLIAVKYISDNVGNPSIFKNYLIAVIAGIIGVVVSAVLGAAGMLSGLGLMGTGGFEMGFAGMLLSMIAALVVAWILSIVSAIFVRRGFNSMAAALNIKMFSTAALLYLIGAILTIVIIGGIISLVAIILQIIAFFQIPTAKPASSAT